VPVPLAGHFQWHLPGGGGPGGPKRRFEREIGVKGGTGAGGDCWRGGGGKNYSYAIDAPVDHA